MAKIIEARVIQKVDTEQNWNANELILYKGEIALVGDPDRVYNIKIGNGVKKFRDLPYMVDYINGLYTDALTPTSDVPSGENNVFLVTQPGTYTNFGNVVLPENNFGFIFKNGNNFSIQSVEMPMQDLTPLESRATALENKNGGDVEFGNIKNVEGGKVFDYVNNKSITKFNPNAYSGGYPKDTVVIHADKIYVSRINGNKDHPIDSLNWTVIKMSADVDQEFDENSENPIANKVVSEIAKSITGFEDKSFSNLINLIPLLTTNGLINNNGNGIIASASGRYALNIPTGGRKFLRYTVSNYSNSGNTFIWGVRADSTKTLILTRQAIGQTVLAIEKDIDISEYTHLDVCYFSNRTDYQNIDIYDSHSPRYFDLKEYIDRGDNTGYGKLIFDDFKKIRKELVGSKYEAIKLADSSSGVMEWFTSFSNNTNTTYGNYTFGWHIVGRNKELYIFKRNNITEEISFTNLTALGLSITSVKSDGHNGFSIAVDKNGYIIIGGDCHGSPIKSIISNNPLDITSWSNILIHKAEQNQITYLRLFKKTDNTLFAIYRTGGSGDGDSWFCRYDEETRSFVGHYEFITGHREGNPYLQTPIIDRNGVIKISYGFRKSAGNVDSNNGMFYIESYDDGVTWTKSLEVLQEPLPINRSRSVKIYNADENSGYINQTGACVDRLNNYATAIQKYKVINNVTYRIFVLIYFDGSEWKSKELFDNDLLNESFYSIEFSRPALFCNDNNELVIIATQKIGTRKMIAINTETFQTKTLLEDVYSEVTFDNEYARDNGIFSSLVLKGKTPFTTKEDLELIWVKDNLL